MKKIQCQLTVCVSAPPTSRPREPPPTATKMYALIARARSPGSGNSVTISAMITEDEIAPPSALDEARDDQHRLVVREPAQRGGGGEHRDAGEEHALAADEVAESPGEQQEAAERDHVRVDHPAEIRLREVQVVLDPGERDVDDRAVERVHQHREAHDDQRDPAAAVDGDPRVYGLDAHPTPTIAMIVNRSRIIKQCGLSL